MQTVIQLISIFSVFPLLISSTSVCDQNPSLIQCIAMKNQFILPRKESCNPLKSKSCETGDLIDPRVATCHLEFSGNVVHSLLENGVEVSYGYRCFPAIPGPDIFHRRNVGPSYGDPRCVPTDLSRHGSFLCGEHGTRCVCDAPADTNEYATQWMRHKCR